MRLLGLVAATLTLTACSTVELTEADAVTSTQDALAEAGVPHDEVTVTDADDDQLTVVAEGPDGAVTLVLDSSAGRFRSIDVDEGVTITEDQFDTLARHRDNPTDDRVRARRSGIVAALVVGAVAVGLGLARRARLREERREG